MAVDTETFGAQVLSDRVPGIPHRAGSLTARMRTILGGVALGVLTGVAFALVLIAAQHATFLSPPALPRYFPSWMAGPLHGLWDGAPSNRGQLMRLSSWAMAAMYVSYLVILLCLVRVRSRWILAAIVAVHVVFLLAPPLSYTDVFNYLNYGRMGIVHHLNPYTTIPALEPHSDPTFAISNWHHLASPYGPLFTLFTYALVPLGVPVSFWVLKVALALASLGTLALLYRTAELLGRDGVRAVAFVGLNPLVLVWGLGADHNDFFMVFFLMLAVYLIVAARQVPSEALAPSLADVRAGHASLRQWAGARELGPELAVVTAVAIKASAAILLPFLLIGAPRRRGMLIGGAIAAAVVGAREPDRLRRPPPRSRHPGPAGHAPRAAQPARPGAGAGRRDGHDARDPRGRPGADRVRGAAVGPAPPAGLDHPRDRGRAGARADPELDGALVRAVGAPARRAVARGAPARRRARARGLLPADVRALGGRAAERGPLQPERHRARAPARPGHRPGPEVATAVPARDRPTG